MKLFNYITIYIIILIILIGSSYAFYFLYIEGNWIAVFALFILYFLSFSFTLIIFVQKRNNLSKLSWILIIIFIPLAGHIIFFLFGRRYSKRKSILEYRKKNNFQFEELKHPIDIKDKNIQALFYKQSNLSNRGVYKCDFQLFYKGDEAFENLFQDLRKAKKFIHLHYYIIKYGEIFEEFKAILIAKAIQGVKIRFIVDDFGSWAMPNFQFEELKKYGIEIVFFGKIKFPFVGSQASYRTHRKVAIIDGKIVHTGGINIADEYSSISKKYGLWLDSNIKIVGKATKSYSLLFIEDWKSITNQELDYKKYLLEKNTGHSKAILVEDSPEINFSLLKNSLIMWIRNAQKSISLSTPYIVPDKEIVNALKIAALSGVDIKIYFPGKSDKKAVYYVTKYWVNELIKYNIKFYKIDDIFLHSKLALFDNKYAYFGTANIDMRSFYSQFEILNLITGPSIKQIDDFFHYCQKLSIKIEKNNLKTNLLKRKLLMIYVNVFSNIM